MNKNPELILLFSGKRKSGKDFITDSLFEKFNKELAVIIKISGPIKSYWGQKNNVALDELLSSGETKEQYRKDMIIWSEQLRKKDPGVFCRQAIEMYRAIQWSVWIVSDVRRKTDIEWFQNNYSGKVKTIRIEASEDSRKKRGWSFVSGVDDVASECDLDDYCGWDWIIYNDDGKPIDEPLTSIVVCIQSVLQVPQKVKETSTSSQA